jgi:hypothetical protein
VTWFSVRSSDFRITKGEPTLFNSTENGVRSFCARCGTQLIFQHADFPDEIDVTTGSLDNPELVPPAIIPARALDSDGSLRTDTRNTRKLVSRDKIVGEEVTIRPFTERDAAQVRQLFITVNRLLSPPDLRDAFEAYIERALTEEIDRIPAYYGERNGGFWVAVKGDELVGTFGLERASDDAMELRRMYVVPLARRQGIARRVRITPGKEPELVRTTIGGNGTTFDLQGRLIAARRRLLLSHRLQLRGLPSAEPIQRLFREYDHRKRGHGRLGRHPVRRLRRRNSQLPADHEATDAVEWPSVGR